VWQLLEVPVELSRVGVEGDDGGDVEVDAGSRALGHPVARRPVIQWRRVAGAPVDQVQVGIVGARHPPAAAAGLPRVATPRRLGLRILGAADGPELPPLLARLRIHREDPSPGGPLAGLRPDQNHVLDDERRAGEPDGLLLGVDELALPDLFAALDVQREQASVDGAHVHVAVADGETAVVRHVSLTGLQLHVDLGVVEPQDFPRGAIQGPHAAVRPGHVDDSVHRERRPLQSVFRRRHPGLEDPGDLEIPHVGAVDLPQRAVAPRVIGSVVGEPAIRILLGVDESTRVDGPGQAGRERHDDQHAEDRRGALEFRLTDHLPSPPWVRASSGGGHRRTSAGKRQRKPSCSRRRLMASSASSDSLSFGRPRYRLMRMRSSRPITRVGRPPTDTVSAWASRSSYVPIGSR